MIRRWFQLLTLLLLAGCSVAAPSLPSARSGTPLVVQPSNEQDELPASLTVHLQATARAIQSLPTSWDTATLRLEHPTLLTQAQEKTLAKGTGLVASGSAYVASTAFGGALRPRSGYVLTVCLWNGGANTALVAEKQVPVNLAAGPNAVSVPLEVYPALNLASFSPATATLGTVVTLSGQGFSVLPSLTQLSLGITGDMQTMPPTSLSTTSITVTIPTSTGPGSKSWQVQVGTSVSTRAGFSVLGTYGNPFEATSAVTQQQDPAIAYGNGQFLAAWTDNRASSGAGIYGVRMTSSGSTTGSEIAIASSDQPAAKPAIAYDSTNNRFLVVYESNNTILGQLVNADGSLQGGVLSIGTGSSTRTDANVAYDATNGQYLVVWSDTRSGDSQIYGQRLDANGGLIGANTLLISVTSTAQFWPHAAYSATANKFLVASTSQSNPKKIMGRVINPDGTFGSAVVMVGQGNQTKPDIAVDPTSGDFLVVWTRAVTGSRDSIMGQRLSAAGAPVGGAITVNAFNSMKQDAQIAYEPGRGTFLVAWGDDRSSDTDLYATHIDLNGTPWGSEFPIMVQPNVQATCDLAVDPTSRKGLVLYQETAGTANKVYGQLTYY